MQVINGQCPIQLPQGLGVSEKPVPRRRSRPGVQTRPWENPGQCSAKHRKARKQGLKPYLSKRKRFPRLTRTSIGIGGGPEGRSPATPPGMRVRTGRFE